jgi:hypothetical protein
MKTCKICEQSLPYDSFYKKTASVDGHKHQCKECLKERNRSNYYGNREQRLDRQKRAQRTYTAKKFGLTKDCLDKMYEEQDGRCAVCGITEEDHGKYLAIDHCHTTGKVRGLLCMPCNTGLGNFKDRIDLLEKAKEYLNG